MLIGNAPCSWGINYPTGNAYTWEEYLDQVAASGYRGTELGPFGFLPKDKAVLERELKKRNLTLIGATHVHTFGDRGFGAGADADAARTCAADEGARRRPHRHHGREQLVSGRQGRRAR